MKLIPADKPPLARDHPSLQVKEYDFEDPTINSASIVIDGRYPLEGYAANSVCTALVIVESGAGSITIKDQPTVNLAPGDHLLVQPHEAYYFLPLGELVIRYISTPAWTVGQSYTVE